MTANLRSLLRALARRSKIERELDAELSSHLRMLEDENLAAGLSPEEARRRARLELGGVDQVKERVRDVRIGHHLEGLWKDARYAARALARNPGFSLVAILTLALGIGANSAIFSVLDAALIQPLPYPEADRLVILWCEFRAAGQVRVPAAGPQLTEIRRRSKLLSDVGGIWVGSGSLTGDGDPEQIRVGQVTGNFFSILGTAPQLGRPFAPSDEGPSASRTAIVGDGLWRRRFGADPRLPGRAVRLDGEATTVVGVMPGDFDVIFPADASVPAGVALWIPFRSDLAREPRDLGYLRMIARLRPGVTIAQAQAELSEIARRLRAEFREYASQGFDLQVAPLHRDSVRDIRPVLLALFGGVALVVLIACANVANLLLARATRREREIGLRAALGASRGRILRQLVTESVLLSLAGGLLGLAAGWGGLKLLLALRPAGLARIEPRGLSPGVLAFTLGLSLATGLLCGLAPVLTAARRNLLQAVAPGRGSAAAAGRARPQRLLVFAEVALGFLLLIGSGLLVRTFVRLLEADPGFRSQGVMTFQVALPESRYRDDASKQRVFRLLRQRLGELPGVASVGASSHLPLDDYPNWYEYYSREGAPEAERNTLMADHRAILPGYFDSLGVRLHRGRDFAESDDPAHPDVVVVDETVARRTWGEDDPIGKRLNVTFIHGGSFEPVTAEVVGVVSHVLYRDLTTQVRGQVYVPYLQSAREQLSFTVRTAGDPKTLAGPIRETVARLDPELAVAKARPMDDYVADARRAARFTAVVAGSLAALALLLACIGIYGVLSYTVAARTGEIGVRLAIGALRRDILWLVVGQALRLIGGGLAAGLLASLVLTGLLSKLLFGVSPRDLPTILAAGLLLAGAGALAAYLPARRAVRIDPIAALRCE
jgi:predicted permease